MSDRAPYSRVYWSVADDKKFVGIYDDDAAFALWTRMLMAADALWPAPAPIPRSARKVPLGKLVDAKIVDLLPGDRYRIHGLDSERGRRASAARRDPDGTQLGPKPDPSGNTAEPSQDKPSQDETSIARDPADIYWQLTGKYPKDASLSWIDDLTRKYGVEAVVRQMGLRFIEDRSVGTFLGRVQDGLRSEARQLDRKEMAAEQAALRQKRAIPRVVEPWREEYRAAIESHYRDLEEPA